MKPSLRIATAVAAGCAVGGAVAAVAVGAWLQRQHTAELAALRARYETCPAYALVVPPWQPAIDEVMAARGRYLPVPERIERRVALWQRVWGTLGDAGFLFVDKRRPWVVHRQLDCEVADPTAGTAACPARVERARRELIAELLGMALRPPAELVERYEGNPALAATAAQNVAVLGGKRRALDVAMARARSVLYDAERIFVAAGLPAALARVAIVESTFDPGAVSPAGAVGAYQLLDDTARPYLQVNELLDERRDPLRAAFAAAAYFKLLREQFGALPLAVTAYNCGPTRLRTLLRNQWDSDLGALVDAEVGQNFGFDGQNFYAQLVAVARLTQKLRPAPTVVLRYLRLAEPTPVAELARCVGVKDELLLAANPAFGKAIRAGAPVPAGAIVAFPAAP